MINRSALAALFLVVLFCLQTGQALPDQPAPTKGAGDVLIVDREKAVWEAIRTRQIEKLRTLFASEYTAIYPTGVRDLQKELDQSATGYLTQYSIEPLRLTRANDNLVVLLYRVTTTIVENGQKKPINLHASSVWVKRGNAWKVLFHTAMPADR